MSDGSNESKKPKTEHRHPPCFRMVCDQHGTPIRQVERKYVYYFKCPACQEADAERPKLSDKDLARTLFLVPPDYDGLVANKYLSAKYAMAKSLGQHSKIPLAPVVAKADTGLQIVVITRRPTEETNNAEIDESPDGSRKIEIKVPPQKRVGEIVESAPISISECLPKELNEGVFFLGEANTDELLERLQEVAYPAIVQLLDNDKRPGRFREPKIVMSGS